MPQTASFPWLIVAPGRAGRRQRSSRAMAPRMAPAAVRIPDPRHTQLPLRFVALGPQIFVHEGARQTLERRFIAAFAGPVQLAVTDNRRRMVSYTQVKGTLRARVHMMFLGAPDRVQGSLVDFVVQGDRQASQVVGDFIEANTHRIRASRSVLGPLRTRGRRHDLMQILADVNERYFASSVSDVLITWGRRTAPGRGAGRKSTKKRATIKLGSYSASERLIRIHPVLDADWVPRYFVSYIVYHELLHHVIPAERVGGRAVLHPVEFERRESEFRHYERAMEWEKKHIDRLLRAR